MVGGLIDFTRRHLNRGSRPRAHNAFSDERIAQVLLEAKTWDNRKRYYESDKDYQTRLAKKLG